MLRELTADEVAVVAGGFEDEGGSGDPLGDKLEEWGRALTAWFRSITSDTDGDGVSDFHDRFEGFDDTTVIAMTDGTFLADGMAFIDGRQLFGHFDAAGQLQQLYLRSIATQTVGSDGGGFNVGPGGVGASYDANDGFTYHFEAIDG